MRIEGKLFILSNGRVAAIDKKTGAIVWEVKLKEYVKTGMAYVVGQLQLDGTHLYVAAAGTLVCLNAKDGALIWKNELKGWGYAFVSMAGQDPDVAAAHAAEAAMVAT